MKVLFLDVDGVLNSAEAFKRWRGQEVIGIDPYMAILVNRIIVATHCKVVLSSSWRGYKEGEEEIQKMIGVPFLSKTPRLDVRERGHEIKAWLDEWSKNAYPNKYAGIVNESISRYAILDDDSDMLEEQLPNFFKTSWQKGITEEITEKVIEHLNQI